MVHLDGRIKSFENMFEGRNLKVFQFALSNTFMGVKKTAQLEKDPQLPIGNRSRLLGPKQIKPHVYRSTMFTHVSDKTFCYISSKFRSTIHSKLQRVQFRKELRLYFLLNLMHYEDEQIFILFIQSKKVCIIIDFLGSQMYQPPVMIRN